ncbi:MAG: GNAT family N-acetyltransferase [Planctomycetes bacterium]|nr:GNAT family N-acetyltransferase [Planctomycetota bacterium]
MAANPKERKQIRTRARLGAFRLEQAERVATWVRTDEEMYWLAPRTTSPLTAEKVRQWVVAGRRPFSLHELPDDTFVGYGELNVLNSERGEYWLGHLIIDPACRGRSLGTALTRLLLAEAFRNLAARRVTLVVFPANTAAVKCYRAAGMREDGYEYHRFPARPSRQRLLRMLATAG